MAAGWVSANEIRIGLLLPPEEPQAASIREAAILAESGQAEGTNHLRVVIRGRAGQWGADGVEVARMVSDDSVQGLIAPPDGAATHLTLQVSGRTSVPVLTLCADSSVSRTGVPWMLRVVPRTTDEATTLFTRIASNGKTASNWLAIVPGDRAGREISSDLNKAARASGVRLETVLSFNANSTNSKALQSLVLKTQPSAILLWLPPIPAGKVVYDLRASGFSGILAGPGWLRSADFVSAAGGALEGFRIPAVVRNQPSEVRRNDFRTAFDKRWHHEPDAMAEMTYDAVSLLADLLDKPEFSPTRHRLGLGLAWGGVTGELTFDSDGNRVAKLELLTGSNGGFVPMK